MAFLFNTILAFIVGLIAGLLGITALSGIYSAAVFLPMLAIQIRRLRDGGNAWWWIFINLIPIVGLIIFIIKLIQPSVAPDGRPQV